MLFVLKSKTIVNQKKRLGQNKFSYELTFLFISIENVGKQKCKKTLRVEINQFCVG